MEERVKKTIIFILLGLVILTSGYQLLFLFVKGPKNLFGLFVGDLAGIMSILLDMVLVIVMILSRVYIANYFESKKTWMVCINFIIFALLLDVFFEISFQYSTPSFQILLYDLMFRSMFFIPWLIPWFFILFFYNFSKKEVFILGALNGMIGEFLLAELFFPGNGMAAKLAYDPLSIIIASIITIVLYGFNLAAPYTAFEESFRQKKGRSDSKIKYLISFIPLYSFCITFLILRYVIQSGLILLFV